MKAAVTRNHGIRLKLLQRHGRVTEATSYNWNTGFFCCLYINVTIADHHGAARISIAKLEVKRPTLEDTFLHLVGNEEASD